MYEEQNSIYKYKDVQADNIYANMTTDTNIYIYIENVRSGWMDGLMGIGWMDFWVDGWVLVGGFMGLGWVNA